MADEEYEILPHQLLQDLKYDVESLKKKLTQPDKKAEELILEIESLKDSIHELTVIFQKALEETKEENLTAVVKTVNERLEAVVSQNETIAKGMIAISDKVEDWMSKQASLPRTEVRPAGLQHTMGAPPMQGSRMAPMPMMGPSGMPAPPFGMPPPPPGPGKKRTGLFK